MFLNRLGSLEKYFFAALIVILAASVFLNLNYGFNNRTIQGRIDFMSNTAFHDWLDAMKQTNTTLKSVETNQDAKQALIHTSQANDLASVLECQIEIARPPDFAQHLYLKMSRASSILDRAVSAIVNKPPTIPQNLSDDTLQRIANITTTIENLTQTIGPIEYGSSSPVQQLQDKGVLDSVINYLEQIEATSLDIWTAYDLYGV